jgi:hypothetical protein
MWAMCCIRTFCPKSLLFAVCHLGEISVEEFQDAFDNVGRNKPTQWLLAAISDNSGVTQTGLADRDGASRRTFLQLVKASRYGRTEKGFIDINILVVFENYQYSSKTGSNESCKNYPRKSALTRRRERRRSSSSISKTPPTSSTRSRVAGGC